jgi:Single-strand binding protein family
VIVNTGPKRVMRARKRSRCSICIKPVTPGRRSHTCRTGCRDSSGCTSAASLRSRCDGRFETTPTIGARSRDRDLRAALSGRHRLCHSQVLSLLSPALLGRPRHAVAAVRAGRADPFHRGAAATEQEAVMAAGEVHLTIVGNLVDEPELRFTPSGVAVAKFRVVSTPRTFDRSSNEWRDGDSLFLICNVWRRAAEPRRRVPRKGDPRHRPGPAPATVSWAGHGRRSACTRLATPSSSPRWWTASCERWMAHSTK